MEQRDRYRRLHFLDAYIEGEEIWTVNNGFSALFTIDMNSWIPYIANHMNSISEATGFHPRTVKRYRDKLIMFSHLGADILIYEFITREMTYHQPRYSQDLENLEMTSADTICIGNKAWLFPKNLSRTLYLFDMDNGTYQSYDIWNKKIMKEIGDTGGNVITSLCLVYDQIWILNNSSRIYAFNPKKEELNSYTIPGRNYLYGIAFDGEDFLLTMSNRKSLLRWNIKKGLIKEYLDDNKDIEIIEPYSRIVIEQDEVFLLPRFEDCIVWLNKDNNKLTRLELGDDFYRYEGTAKSSLMYGYRPYKNRLLIFPWSGNKLIDLDIRTRLIEKRELIINEKDFKERFLYPKYLTGQIYESNLINPNTWIDFVIEQPDLNKIDKNNNSYTDEIMVGEKIWKVLAYSKEKNI